MSHPSRPPITDDPDDFDDDEFEGLESLRVTRYWGDDLDMWVDHIRDSQQRCLFTLESAGSQSWRSSSIDMLLDAAHRVALGIASGDDDYARLKMAMLRDIVKRLAADLGVGDVNR